MISVRSLCSIALVLVASGAAGCKEDPPPPQPEPASSAAANKGKAKLRTPVSSIARVDPQSMKEYRVDVCYFGTLSLKQARDAYLASLGKDEPSEKKIPSFGIEDPTKPGDAAKAAPPAKPAAPGAKAGPSRVDARRRPFNFSARAPHERNARACTVAVSLKDPPMPEVDPVLAEYAPFATDLAKSIAAAANYYQREEYKKDKFEKGKELHKKLLDGFEKLDAQSEKLGAVVSAWHASHPPDLSTADEGRKAAITALEDARALMLLLTGKSVDTAAVKAAVQKLEASAGALKAHGTSNQTDPWSKIMAPTFEAFINDMKAAEPKLTDKGISSPSLFLPVITRFVSLIEGKHRAHSRSLRSQMRQAGASTAKPAAPAAPAPQKE
ncbi:hypothetical protein SOCEGT47_010470 [Sorangium cellulosum]|uniref:Secreted protein n=1 Tax=Sorangium cellulosum TaxID=56 RepID=A0A4P2PUY9_SORCE|nr:DUF3829 domain-containing protein [Sorangium cellulosum]AUX20575.1 hypothetical protein SOCEGT47_010470 [Sorangium cellulosum]